MNYKKYKLKDLVDNFSVRARDYGGSDGLEFLGVSNDDGIVKSKSAAEHKGEEYKIIEKGCFAYNPYRINIGSIAYHNEDINGLISPAYVIFKTKPNSIKDNLLFKFLKSAEGLRQIRFHGRGTVRQALRFEDLCKIEISIPTYNEQEKLISSIEKTEIESNLISSELNHQLDLIKQLRQAFLREAMQGSLTPTLSKGEGDETGQQLLEKIKAEKAQLIADKKLKKEKELAPISEDEIPFEIPKHWVWCRLGEMSINCDGARKPISQSERQNKDKIYDYYGASGVIDKIDGFTHDGKFLLIGEDGANLIAKSTPIAFIAEGKFWVNNHAHVLDFLDDITKTYMKYCLNTIDIKPFISGGFQPKLNQANLNLMQIPLPPLHEQEQIVAKLEELMAYCDGLEQSIKESQGYNEMLLQEVLREALQGEKV
jgi:type I restriction enzyme S subunit